MLSKSKRPDCDFIEDQSQYTLDEPSMDSYRNDIMAPQGEGGEWAKKADMPTARSWMSTSIVRGKIYAIGGWKPGAFLSTVEEYTPEDGQSVFPNGKLRTTWGQRKLDR